MTTPLATAMPKPERLRPRKPRIRYHESDIGLLLMAAGLLYGLWLSFRFDPTYGWAPAVLLAIGALLVAPEVRRISRHGRRVARR